MTSRHASSPSDQRRGVFIGLGGNLGDPLALMRAALLALDSAPRVRVVGVSSVYRSPAWGPIAQAEYLNAAAELETALEPLAVLDVLLATERDLGRVRHGPRFGPRTIDIDYLFDSAHVLQSAVLELPHPRLHGRAFALKPLAELAPTLVLPGHGAIAGLLESVAGDATRVVRTAPPVMTVG